MDLSDGLMGDLPKILQASNVAASVDARAFPVAAAVRALFPDDWLDLAMRGGEDYELLFTVPRDRWGELVEAAAQSGDVVTEIGEIGPTEDGSGAIATIAIDGSRTIALPGAFDHFALGKNDIGESTMRAGR
jgi:thiamine-monophosphate kinase